MKKSGDMAVLVFSLSLAIGACTVSGQGTIGVETTPVVYQEPPPPRVETVTMRPGYIYIKGRWNWQNGNWAWVGGHYENQRAGYAWTEGRWENRGNRWEWVDGSWTVSTQPAVVTGGAEGGVSVSGDGGGNNAGWNTTTTTVQTTGGAQGGVVVSGGGGTVVVSAYPSAAPPPVRVETMAARAGFVWIAGRWDWRSGNWAWVDGHYERERANQAWV
ncbi:MAG: hypothetical protein ACRENC_18375, partial [Gemmatimonadaceae bacterium]